MNEIEFKNRLDDILPKLYEQNEVQKSSKKEVDSYKDEVKALFEELGINEYSVDGIKVSITEIEKSSLKEALVIEYLKSKGLNHLIKTKEYIDESEILMAASRNEFNPLDLEPFMSVEIQKRINIKRGK